jgi:acetyl-CoA carboxylase biotin carboxylase subunit
MGDKVRAKEAAVEIGLPVVPGSPGAVRDAAEAAAVAKEIGFPILLKAAAGGGGRGMKIAQSADELPQALSTCRAEAKAAFGDDTVYLEKLLVQPRHIELQILGDGKGQVLHFGERDCSLQRRHQKVMEDAPSPALNEEARERIGSVVCEARAKLK